MGYIGIIGGLGQRLHRSTQADRPASCVRFFGVARAPFILHHCVVQCSVLSSQPVEVSKTVQGALATIKSALTKNKERQGVVAATCAKEMEETAKWLELGHVGLGGS